jgi:hypothetical protein
MLEHRSGGGIRNIPAKHADDFAAWRRALNRSNALAEQLIRNELNGFIDKWQQEHSEKPNDAFSSSWVPGLDWGKSHSGTFQPIYDALWEMYGGTVATLTPDDADALDRLVFTRAGWFFGLLLMDVFIHRENDTWVCWHEPHPREMDLLGMFYRPKEAQRREAA